MSKNNTDKLRWTFLTNHAHVLLCLANNNSMLMKDVAKEVGITERAVQQIIADLVEEGYITRIKEGRCNIYQINKNEHLRHPIESKCLINSFINLIFEDEVPLKNTNHLEVKDCKLAEVQDV